MSKNEKTEDREVSPLNPEVYLAMIAAIKLLESVCFGFELLKYKVPDDGESENAKNELLEGIRYEFDRSKRRIEWGKEFSVVTNKPLPTILYETIQYVSNGKNRVPNMRRIIDAGVEYAGSESILDECLELVEKKNNDYSGDEDPLKNFRLCEKVGICPTEMGVLVRLCDKLSRFENLYDGKEMKVEDEKIKDTLMDIINYSAIFLSILEMDRSR